MQPVHVVSTLATSKRFIYYITQTNLFDRCSQRLYASIIFQSIPRSYIEPSPVIKKKEDRQFNHTVFQKRTKSYFTWLNIRTLVFKPSSYLHEIFMMINSPTFVLKRDGRND